MLREHLRKGQASVTTQGKASGTVPPPSMNINDMSSLFELNTDLQEKVWHVSDELSTMQGESVQRKREMARIGKWVWKHTSLTPRGS